MDNTENMSNEITLEELLPLIEEKLAAGGEVVFKPRGTSMLPLIRQGIDSVALILPNGPKKGDIVLYRRANGQFVLHRIVGKKNREFIMCGDNQCVKERGITEKMMIGVVKRIARGGRQIMCTNFLYRAYVSTLPVRRLLMRTKGFAARLLGKAGLLSKGK